MSQARNNFTANVARGCGETRTSGDAYITYGLGLREEDKPLEDYLICPVKPLVPETLGISPIGVSVYVRNGVTNIIDWVGSKFYKNVADILEEIRRFGLSRKISRSVLTNIAANYPPLTLNSKIILIHSKAYIHDYLKYPRDSWECVKPYLPHEKPHKEMCASLWWEDLKGETVVDVDPRLVEVTLPSFSYLGRSGLNSKHSPACIAAFPIGEIQIPQDIISNKHIDTGMLAKNASQVPVRVTQL